MTRGAGGEALRETVPERGDDLLQPRRLDGRRHIVRQVSRRMRPLPLTAAKTIHDLSCMFDSPQVAVGIRI